VGQFLDVLDLASFDLPSWSSENMEYADMKALPLVIWLDAREGK
jgi:hypothetical protein